MEEFNVTSGYPYPLGVNVLGGNTVNFAVVIEDMTDSGLILYEVGSKKTHRIPFDGSMRIGNVCCLQLHNIDYSKYEYNYYTGDTELTDPYAKALAGTERWGKKPSYIRGRIVRSNLTPDSYSPIKLNYSESVIYLLHVRGFTRHKSSEVSAPGTFGGIVEKLPYLKELGVTTIELMPAYEFSELDDSDEVAEDIYAGPKMYEDTEKRVNFWGYKKAFYFAPKASYVERGVMPNDSFKRLVKEVHDNGMELVMQFYFPPQISRMYILDVLRYWVSEYHIDGIHLFGADLPLRLYATDPMLADSKLMYYDFDSNDIYGNKRPKYRRLARYNDGYMYNARRFLKSDEGQAREIVSRMRGYDDKIADIGYLTNYDGFTLMDVVSYDRKHNEANGENNRDGNMYNASWNCGYEGATTKKSVLKLRKRQIKNAIILNTLFQPTPMIRGGDEFGNSQKGNNNPYCIDNAVTWLNWKDLDKNSDIYEFYKLCLKFRREHKILHTDSSYKLTDYLSIGYPDLSIHGEEAWMADLDDLTRNFALLYAEAYSDDITHKIENSAFHVGEEKNDTNMAGTNLVYLAINMHWSTHSFALPKIPSGKRWKIAFDTATDKSSSEYMKVEEHEISVSERSIRVLVTCDI